MKKFATLMLALLMLTASCTLAFTGSGYPAWDGSSAPNEGLYGDFGGEKLKLEFDPSQEYSIMDQGSVQACFFAFDSAEQNYLEIYLILPDNLSTGSVYTARDGAGSTSISLYEVSKDTEVLYFAGQVAGAAYPEGSDYEIRIESAELSGNALRVNGSLSAQLSRIESSHVTGEFLTISNARFSFALPVSASAPAATPKSTAEPESTFAPENSALPENTARPEPTLPPLFQATPRPTMDPHPAFTLPPDYRVI